MTTRWQVLARLLTAIAAVTAPVTFGLAAQGEWKGFASPPAGTGVVSNWAHFLGPNYNGVPYVGTFDPQGIQQLWSRELGPGCASVTIVEGKLYTMGNRDGRDVVYCLDAKTGEEVWTFAYDCDLMPKHYDGGPNSTPAIADGRVFTLSRKGQVHCLDVQSGKKIWATSVEKWKPKGLWYGFSDSPIVWDDCVFVNVTEKGLVFMHSRHGLSKVSRVGDKWLEDWICKELVYNKWDWFTFNRQVIHKGHLIALAGRGSKASDRMMCVDLETGEVKWQEPMPFGNLILADDKLITVTQRGEIAWGVLDGVEYTETFRKKMFDSRSWSHPVLHAPRRTPIRTNQPRQADLLSV